MGCEASKNVISDEELPVVDGTADGSEIVESEDKHDAQEIRNMLNELRTKPENFILNNLLMCVVLFRNFEKDLYDFSNTVVPKEETDLNFELEKEVKSCILPDTLLDKIQENIRFGSEHELLINRNLYITNENIEVKDAADGTFYTNIDVPGCTVVIEEDEDDLLFTDGNNTYKAKRNEPRYGFLKLRVLEKSSKMNRDQFVQRRVSADSDSTGSSDSSTPAEQSDEYSTITAFKTPKSLHIVQTAESERRDTLPESCFATRLRWLTAVNDNDDEEDEEERIRNEEETDDFSDYEDEDEDAKKNGPLYEEVEYLSSKGFMEYFQNNIFPNITGRILGFSDNALEAAQAVPGSILCNRERPGENIPFRIIPAVTIDWPAQATEYQIRTDRRTIIDQKHGVVYRWPTNDMVKELMTLKCVAIPKGFVMKKGENENSDIEWEIHFPKAERYLEIRMTHPQVRCYVFLMALYKTYVEKVTTFHGLQVEHIRTHMFWECEADARNWPEHKMGQKLLKVLEDLNDGLSRNRIRHYFIRKKNGFEDIPSKYQQYAQKAFYDVIQFPVMHFIKALKNLKYFQSDYYPAPDLDQLQRILTGDIYSKTKIERPIPETSKNRRKSLMPVGTVRNVNRPRIKDERLKKTRENHNRRKVIEKQQIEKEKEEKLKKSTVVENLKISFSDLGNLTKSNLLRYFIHQFIDIARKSRRIGPKSQTILYLKQAWYNTKVLEAITYPCEETENLLKIIEKERLLLERNGNLDLDAIAPPTPMRNPEQNCFDFQQHGNLKLKPSFKKNNRILKRPKSVGFDESVKRN